MNDHGLCGVCLSRRSSDPVRASRSGDDVRVPPPARPVASSPDRGVWTEGELRLAWGDR